MPLQGLVKTLPPTEQVPPSRPRPGCISGAPSEPLTSKRVQVRQFYMKHNPNKIDNGTMDKVHAVLWPSASEDCLIDVALAQCCIRGHPERALTLWVMS